ncbi:MAG: serine/threonine-protein phosphatase, partial [Synergistaceae bacterium]|nr:serine/threonine-protein phosphatase [Synergistaceae bacterium]
VAGSALKNLVRAEPDIERVFTMLNARLCERNSEGYFVTAFAGIFDSSTSRLRYINAGHPLPCIRLEDGVFRPLPCEVNLVLGGFEDARYSALETSVPTGSVLYVYTDGVVEAMNEKAGMYSVERLVRALGSTCDDPRKLVEHVFEDVTHFVGDVAPSDDVTMLCVRF